MSQRNTINYWLVVDTIRIPDAISVIANEMKVEQAIVLFAGSDFDYLKDKSPLVLNIGSNSAVLEQWLTLPNFDSSSVIFELDSRYDGFEFTDYLQSLLQVKVDSKACFLRFYTNAFWNQTASQLNDIDIATLLGPAQAIHWVDTAHNKQILHYPVQVSESFQAFNLTSPIFKLWV
ncbi:DUF4123 domain-containing protein [Vibrio fluvialis]|nr:DUF4123 domain-containing protein [Vibrio fluvialis]